MPDNAGYGKNKRTPFPDAAESLRHERGLCRQAGRVYRKGSQDSHNFRRVVRSRPGQQKKTRIARLVKVNKKLRHEIDMRRHAEKLLQLEKNKLKTILDAMDDGVCIISRDFDIEYVNPVLEKDFGPVNGQKCYEYFFGGEGVCRWCNNRDIFAGNSFHWECYNPKTKKTYDLYDTLIKNSDGSSSKLVFLHDITERKKTEEILLAYQKELRSMAATLTMVEERERRAIAADIHDYISQSLAAARIRLEAIKQSSPPPGILEDLRLIGSYIEEAIGYTQSLITNLSISTLHDIDLVEALEWLCKQMEERHGIRISYEKKGEFGPIDEEPRVIIFKSVRELLNNAVKHSKAKNVKVSIRKSRLGISVTVEDDGIGFEVGQARKRLGKKGGFGLFSIGESLKHLGGSITIGSEPGKGTVIVLNAPLKSRRRGSKK